MNVREWLERVRMLDELIDTKIAEREQLRSLATKVVSDMDGMPHAKGGVSDPVGSNVVRIVALMEEIDRLVDQYIDHRQRVIEALESLPEMEYIVLHKYYIQYKTWERVAEETNYSTMQIWRIRKKGMRHLEEVIECYV
jgi:DNA-directed RNA polymerase specialized sigma subunit